MPDEIWFGQRYEDDMITADKHYKTTYVDWVHTFSPINPLNICQW